MISQIVAAFGLENDENAVEASFRGQFYPKIEKFLNGTSRRQYVLFGYQKPRDARNAGSGAPDPSLDAKLICTGKNCLTPLGNADNACQHAHVTRTRL